MKADSKDFALKNLKGSSNTSSRGTIDSSLQEDENNKVIDLTNLVKSAIPLNKDSSKLKCILGPTA